ncbi:MAG: molybdopterin molybdotransferase MoeA [Euryarchaeota archaeon]|nr:molybdopterin molybdotransferase MoeA [Euryarchaeota archaeon]
MEVFVPLSRAREIVDSLREKYYFRRKSLRVRVSPGIAGRELAEDVIAEEDSPPHPIASYDGYAMKSKDSTRYPLRITGSIYAGEPYETLQELRSGEAVYIATGAFLPPGADCVLKLEDAKVEGDLLYGVPIEEGTKVVPAGSNYRRGELLLRARTRLRAQEIGILAALGVEEVEVYRRLRVGVLATGDEIVKGTLRDINSPVVLTLLEQWGCCASYLGAVEDSYRATRQALEDAARRYDCVVTSGGVSVGRRDCVLRAMEELGEVLMYRVRTRPGKPVAIGLIDETPVFALPGKPTGALIAAQLHLRRYILGAGTVPYLKAAISEDVVLSRGGVPDMANILFLRLENGYAVPMGFPGSEMPLIKRGEKYSVSTIASNLRSTLVDGYAILDKDTRRGETVKVHLFS